MKSLFFCGIVAARAQTADEIIQKYVTAIGGRDNWNKIRSLKYTASLNASGVEMQITSTILYKKGCKTEITLDGNTSYSIITPNKGWTLSEPGGKVEPMKPEDVSNAQEGLEIGNGLFDYKAKGNKVVYEGRRTIDGKMCFQLHATLGGREMDMYIDVSSYYLVRTESKINNNGRTDMQVVTFADYRKFKEGIFFPMAFSYGMGTASIKTIEVNFPVDEKIFIPVK